MIVFEILSKQHVEPVADPEKMLNGAKKIIKALNDECGAGRDRCMMVRIVTKIYIYLLLLSAERCGTNRPIRSLNLNTNFLIY